MHLPLSLRFFHFFFKGLFGTMREKIIDCTVLAFALVFSVRAGYHGQQRWELAFPWIEAFCAIVFWHSLSAAHQLFNQISRERIESAKTIELPVLEASGGRRQYRCQQTLHSFIR